jgi:hypothetical protein
MAAPSPARIRTFWACDRCWLHGSIEHDAHAGIWEVIEALSVAHRDSSGDRCRASVRDLRVHLSKIQQRKKRA